MIRRATGADRNAWARMRTALWPEETEAVHHAEIASLLADPARQVVFVAEGQRGALIGFAECSIRHVAEGCRTPQIGYLEGWYVEPSARRTGLGRALLAEGERWAREHGCREFASDADPSNEQSRAAHVACGFADVGQVRAFRKDLAGSVSRAALADVIPVLPSRDVKLAIGYYVNVLGFTCTFRDNADDPHYAGVARDGVRFHLQWHDAAEWDRVERPLLRLVVPEVETLFTEYEDAGVFHERTALRDTAWGTREFAFFDLDMNGLVFTRDLTPRLGAVASETVTLRPIDDDDLPILFAHHADPTANHMAAFTARDPDDHVAFTTHWQELRATPSITMRTVLCAGEVAGHIGSFDEGDERHVTYWIAREHWGRGLATIALRKFLQNDESRRPLSAAAAKDNEGSHRVLVKNGFVVTGETSGVARARGEETPERVYRLDKG